MRLSSPAFADHEMIPPRFTCDGENISPPLAIEQVPEGTETLALVVEDPDAPGKTWTHWIVYNIAPVNQIPEDSPPGQEAANDFGQKAYGGPCPPSGTHHYFFRLYALDTRLDLKEAGPREEFEAAMEGHVLEEAELVGLYQRQAG